MSNNQKITGGPIRICDSKLRNCNYYSKNITGSSGNVVITGQTQSQILTRLVNLEQYRRGHGFKLMLQQINMVQEQELHMDMENRQKIN